MAVKKTVKKKPIKKPVVKKIVNEVGRPASFKTNNDLQKKIDEYFEYIKGEFEIKQVIVDDMPFDQKVFIRESEPATITGLALFLGFESRQSIYDYEKNGEFSYTIKRARLKVENGYEIALFGRNSTGAIFGLKNFGWADKQEIDHTTNGDSINPTPITFTKGSNG